MSNSNHSPSFAINRTGKAEITTISQKKIKLIYDKIASLAVAHG